MTGHSSRFSYSHATLRMSVIGSNRQKRRASEFQLTEDEIQKFVAHNSDEDGSESDWDDIGEADLSSFLTPSTHSQTASSEATTTTAATTATSITNSVPTTCSTIPASPAVRSTLKDVGVDDLFGKKRSNTSHLNDQLVDPLDLFGSDSSDDDNLPRTEGGDDSDIPLCENGIQIQRSLAAAQRAEHNREIDRQVERAISDAVEDEKSHPRSHLEVRGSMERSSVSYALAACAARRRKAISDLNGTVPSSSGPERRLPNSPLSAPVHYSQTDKTDKDQATSSPDSWIAAPTKLRVHRSCISSELWLTRTAERQVFNLAQFISRCRTQNALNPSTKHSRTLQGAEDAVLVGVIGNKMPPRRSRNDRVYSVWSLSDLEQVGPGGSLGCVKLFLFGKCHEKLWKEADGSVVAVLSPRLLSDSSTSMNEKDVSITLESPLHLMVLGQSPDYGVCAATSKSGQACFHVVNRTVCRYCDFHVKKAYYEASSSRPGFVNASFPTFAKRRCRRGTADERPENEHGIYSLPTPQSFMMDGGLRGSSGARIRLSVAKLTAAGYNVDSSIGLGSQNNKNVTSTVETQNNSTRNPIASTQNSNPNTPSATEPVVERRASETERLLTSPERKLIKALRRPTAGSLNLLRQLEKSAEPPKTNKRVVDDHSKPNKSLSSPSQPEVKNSVTFSKFFASVKEQKSSTSSSSLLTDSHRFVDLGPLPSALTRASPQMSASRLKASALVRSRGGVDRMNLQEKQKKRAHLEATLSPTVGGVSPLSQVLDTRDSARRAPKQAFSSNVLVDSTESNTENQPPLSDAVLIAKQKRAQRLAELAKQVKQGSAHVSLIAEAENQSEQTRMAVLERRDEYEQRLTEKTEEPCTYVHCKTCNYRAWKAAPDCRNERHTLEYIKGVKRYFRCRNCMKRTITFDRYPARSCKNCGESLFEKTGVIAERKGPDLPGEKLLPRGLEEKFLG
ncbi:unnamed protein product [Calicophoron daubneyi]|uniref:Protein MCM10 homolog n=1 Tax=Calicophoron daubneyi TaxID=300641 RepID=A0AAV2TUV0_CALDB